jgi:UDP-N-acetylmuramoyl-tripeptide--D-alanyl-D-alanine ligase
VRDWDLDAVADAAGAVVALPARAAGPVGPTGSVRGGDPQKAEARAEARAYAHAKGPVAVSIDSRSIAQGDLFVGLPGERHDGGAHAAEALRAGAWGVLVRPDHAHALTARSEGVTALAEASEGVSFNGAVLVHEDPLAALQALAKAWLAELRANGARVVAITGSTGKTSTKDILAVLLGQGLTTFASPANFNTEIGLPLAILSAPAGTEALVLEMAMRGRGQIAELAEIAEPEVGVIVNVGPVHLELLGTVEAVAAAKAELIAGLAVGSTAIVPSEEPLLDPYLRDGLRTVRFGPGGDVRLAERRFDGTVVIEDAAFAGEGAEPRRIVLEPSFGQAHNLDNLVAAVAGALALGVTPGGQVKVRFSAMRGQRVELPRGTTLIEDCYNANPMSMKAALDDLAGTATGRRVAVLGDMLELGPEELRYHREVGAYARARGVGFLVAVGPKAAAMTDAFAEVKVARDAVPRPAAGSAVPVFAVPDAAAAAALLADALEPGDTVLVKGSRGVGLERVVDALRGSAREQPARAGGR